MKTRNIGGSVLPSNSPEILTSTPFLDGNLQVVVDSENDTHCLLFGEDVISQHPNGFSNHSLLMRLLDKPTATVLQQADYIVSCGGHVDYPLLRRLLEKRSK